MEKIVGTYLGPLLAFWAMPLVIGEHILTSRVFVIPIKPDAFNWSINVFSAPGENDRYSYETSLLNAPDLPPWVHYKYSKADHQGYLYGVAPRNQQDFTLEIVALDKLTYNISYKTLEMNVQENSNFAKYQVQLKIDNLNVEDLFDANKTEKLFNIFGKDLWKEAKDLQLTFLGSAVELGARLPLQPQEFEGVVLRLGTSVPFSKELLKLEEELKPLRKHLTPCARKRTSVERFFRGGALHVDWCSFRLIEENESSSRENEGENLNVVGLPFPGVSERSEWRWKQPTKSGVPRRSYIREITTTVFIPAFLLLLLAGLLSFALCLHHDKLIDPESDDFFTQLFNVFLEQKAVLSPSSRCSKKRESSPVEGLGNNGVQMVQYAASYTGNTLKSLTSQPPSPADSLSQSPRLLSNCSNNPYVRPNPPPYMGVANIAALRTDS